MDRRGVGQLTLALALGIATVWACAARGGTLGTEFTYQGRLQDAGAPVNGMVDLKLTLWDAVTGGKQIGPTQGADDLPVVGGLFTVPIDFGAGAFGGDARWLEISLRPGGSVGQFTTLKPRQPLTATPYALFARAAPWSGLSGIPAGFADGDDDVGWATTGNAGTDPDHHFLGTTDDQPLEIRVGGFRALRLEPDATSPNLIGGHSGNTVAAGVYGATIGGGGGEGTAHNRARGHHSTVGGGAGNLAGTAFGDPASGAFATVGGGQSNTAFNPHATVGGGEDNRASDNHATVGGGLSNTARAVCATVGGGESNEAAYDHATVAGGRNNRAMERCATVGGGSANRAGYIGATVAGGESNQANYLYATVGGGYSNTADHDYATVGGGYSNQATGWYATVPGGQYNDASARYSFAAGRRAKASHQGAFVWADSSDFDFASNRANVFRARATGGVRFVTAIDGTGAATAGPWLDAGDNTWNTPCDRTLKEHFQAVDGRDVLARVVALPIATWNAKSQSPDIRHMGPVAQDFHAAFGLGSTDKAIATVDADGVALAAIQGLHQIVHEREAQLADMAARLDRKEGEVTELEERLARLEALMATIAPAKTENQQQKEE